MHRSRIFPLGLLFYFLTASLVYKIQSKKNNIFPKAQTSLKRSHQRRPVFSKVPPKWSWVNESSSNRLDGCTTYVAPENPVIIIRVANAMSEIKKSVVLNYSRVLGQKFDLWVLVDHTSVNADGLDMLQGELMDLQNRAPFPIHIFMYDVDLEKRVFCAAARRLDKIGPTVNYITHAVSVVLWWRLCGGFHDFEGFPSNPNSVNPSVWIVEMDAGFSGDPRAFFEFYQDQTIDLVVNRIWQPGELWLNNRKEAAVNASWEFSDEDYYVKNDFVVGMSLRLLYHMDALIRSGVIMYGEAYEATVCKNIFHDWCIFRSFSDDGFAGEVLRCDGMIDDYQWKMYNEQPEYQNKWYHAVMARKEHRVLL